MYYPLAKLKAHNLVDEKWMLKGLNVTSYGLENLALSRGTV